MDEPRMDPVCITAHNLDRYCGRAIIHTDESERSQRPELFHNNSTQNQNPVNRRTRKRRSKIRNPEELH